jgi:hypothetical protein
MLKGTDALAKFGVIGDITTDKFKQMGITAGYSVQRLEELAGVYKELGSDIAGLGGSATAGAKAFNEIIKADENVLQQYSRLGVTQNQLNKNQAEYITLQIASGQQITERAKQDGSLRKASIQYTDNLMDLSALTGMEVDEIKKKQEAQRADLAYSIRQAQLQDKELALRAEFEKTGNQELNVRANALEKERKNSESLQDVAIVMGLSGKELSAFNSMIATGNFNELSAGFAAGTPGILEFIKAVKEGKRAPAELISFMSEANKVGRERFGEAIIQSKEVGEAVNISVETMRNETRFRGKSNEEIMAIVAEEKAAREKQKQGGIDAAKDARAQQQTTERSAQRAFDGLIGIMQGPLTKAFENLQSVINSFSKWVASIVDRVTGSNLSDMFKSLSEVREDKDKNAKAIDKITKRIEAVKKLPKGRGMGASIAPLEKQRLELLERQKVLENQEAALDTAPKPASTSANTSSGMTGYLQKIAQVESGGKASAKAGTSSASGLFQFTEDTWKGVTKEMGKNYSLQDRFDPQKSAEVAKYFTEKQKGQLEKGLERTATDADLYMAHFLGAGGATKFLKAMANNPGALATEGADPEQIESNKPIFYEDGGKGRMRTLQEVYDLMSRKIDKAGEVIAAGKGGEDIGKIQQGRFGGMFSGSDAGYPVMLHGKEMVIPMPDTNSLDVQKTELSEVNSTNNNTQNITENNSVDNMKAMYDMIDMLSTKMDAVIDQLATGNDYTDQLLKYSRV